MVECKGRKHADFVSKLWGQRFQRRLFEWGNSIPSGRWRGKGEEAFMCDCDLYACVNKSVSFFLVVYIFSERKGQFFPFRGRKRGNQGFVSFVNLQRLKNRIPSRSITIRFLLVSEKKKTEPM